MTVTLHKPSLRLAGLYLAIMMAISLFFSASIYQLSIQEVDRGLRGVIASNSGPRAGVMVAPFEVSVLPETIRQKLADEREAQYQEARSRIIRRLVTTNLFILVAGGILSYYLARRTLGPIEEAQQAQSRFTADASHELRTPIAAMRSEIEVALMNPKLTLANAKAQLQSNLEELARLTTLSDGLLRLARLEDHTIGQSKTNVDAIIRRAVDRVLPLAEAKRMLITLPTQVHIPLKGDEDSLVEALVTVLDNAVKYSPEKTEVTVRAHAEKHQAIIRITDHGIGIKATELPHIFDRFYRADSARTRQQIQGYGLGLAIAKNIIEAHGGTITATSTPGRGTIFTITVPCGV